VGVKRGGTAVNTGGGAVARLVAAVAENWQPNGVDLNFVTPQN